MSRDPSRRRPRGRNWQDRLRHVLARDPQDRQQLWELLTRSEQQGLLDSDTLAMFEGALNVSEMQVRDIMVPRAQMVVLEEDMEPDRILPLVVESGHSRFPVLDERHERVLGILLAKDLLNLLANGGQERFDIKDFTRPAVFVPESKRLNVLLREFRTSRNHLAVVVDEYGGPAGIVTIEDVIEQIVGEIDDEHDIDEEVFVKQHRGERYTVLARMPVDQFNAHFGSELPEEEFDTIGGLLVQRFGHVPKRGEKLYYGGFDFKILRADKRRPHLLRVVRQPAGQSPDAAGAG